MNTPNRYRLVAAIYPNSRGIAFVLFEGLSAKDWMVTPRRGPSKLRHVLRRIGVQFERYPLIDALVLQDMSPEGTRRSRRIRELNDAIAEYAETYGIPVFTYSREQVQGCFQQFGLVTKYGIAETIAKHIPELAYQLPRVRKLWMSEDSRMGVFDAAALALTFLYLSGQLS
jgi:hypothetical protein